MAAEDSRSLGMKADLRDTVTRAILGHLPAPSHNDNDDYAEADEYACAALAALGLDDLDAAVERGARAMFAEEWRGRDWAQAEGSRDVYLAQTRLVLEAALTATDAKGSPDA